MILLSDNCKILQSLEAVMHMSNKNSKEREIDCRTVMLATDSVAADLTSTICTIGDMVAYTCKSNTSVTLQHKHKDIL